MEGVNWVVGKRVSKCLRSIKVLGVMKWLKVRMMERCRRVEEGRRQRPSLCGVGT